MKKNTQKISENVAVDKKKSAYVIYEWPLKIWTAWGDEKKFVKFVVKRVSERSQSHSSTSNNHRKRLRRRGSVSSVDELHPKALHVKSKLHDKVRTYRSF